MGIEERNALDNFWELFERMTDKQKVEWLLEFEMIFDAVKDWDCEELKEQSDAIKEMVMTKEELIEDKL